MISILISAGPQLPEAIAPFNAVPLRTLRKFTQLPMSIGMTTIAPTGSLGMTTSYELYAPPEG
jgi:hypothetical protein